MIIIVLYQVRSSPIYGLLFPVSCIDIMGLLSLWFHVLNLRIFTWWVTKKPRQFEVQKYLYSGVDSSYIYQFRNFKVSQAQTWLVAQKKWRMRPRWSRTTHRIPTTRGSTSTSRSAMFVPVESSLRYDIFRTCVVSLEVWALQPLYM